MSTAIKLNDICFSSIDELKEFVSGNKFIDIVLSNRKNKNKIFEITLPAKDGLDVYLSMYNRDNGFTFGKDYEAKRFSGGNYSDESEEQKKASKELDDILSIITNNLKVVEDNKNQAEDPNDNLPY